MAPDRDISALRTFAPPFFIPSTSVHPSSSTADHDFAMFPSLSMLFANNVRHNHAAVTRLSVSRLCQAGQAWSALTGFHMCQSSAFHTPAALRAMYRPIRQDPSRIPPHHETRAKVYFEAVVEELVKRSYKKIPNTSRDSRNEFKVGCIQASFRLLWTMEVDSGALCYTERQAGPML